MSNNNLFAFYDQPGRDNPYGKLYPNSSMQTPTHLENGNTNTWVYNKNLEGSIISEVWSNLALEMIRQTRFLHLKFATGDPIIAPRRAGTARVTVHRYRPLGVVINPLKEGELPEKLVFGSEKTSATYTHFGAYMEITDVLEEQSQDDMFMKYGADLVRSANESFDIITREFMYKAASYAFANGCATVEEVSKKGIYFNAAAAGDNTWKSIKQRGAQLTFSDIREQITKMKLKKVNPHPTYGKFIVLVGIEGIDHLRNDGEFKSWHQHEDPSIYDYYDRVYVSTDIALYEIENAKTVVSEDKKSKVGVAFIIGDDAYKEVKLQGGDIQIITKDFGTVGFDPLNQISTMGWKATFGLASIRSEALVALHYSLSESGMATKTFGTRIEWDETGKATEVHDAEYTFTELKDGRTFFVDMEGIYSWKDVSPMPYPTDQHSYVKNLNKEKQADGSENTKAMWGHTDPGMQFVVGLLSQLDPAIIEKIKDGKIDIVSAINSISGGGSKPKPDPKPEKDKSNKKNSLNLLDGIE